MSPPSDSASIDPVEISANPPYHPTSRADSKAENCPELQRIIDAWRDLPAALRAGILAMIDAARNNG
jgi:hypothetical protein